MANINQLITNFYDEAVARDFARDFNFRIVAIQPEPSLGITFTENDLVYAKSGKIPERAISNVTASYMGLNFNLPGVASYPNSENFSLEFYCDRAQELRSKFEQWSRATFDDATSTGNYSVPTRASYIQMAQLNPDFTVVKQFKLVGVSIRSVGDIEYKISEGTGTIQSFSSSVAYHYYEIL